MFRIEKKFNKLDIVDGNIIPEPDEPIEDFIEDFINYTILPNLEELLDDLFQDITMIIVKLSDSDNFEFYFYRKYKVVFSLRLIMEKYEAELFIPYILKFLSSRIFLFTNLIEIDLCDQLPCTSLCEFFKTLPSKKPKLLKIIYIYYDEDQLELDENFDQLVYCVNPAYVNTVYIYYTTILQYMVQYCDLNLLKELMDLGANPYIKSINKNNDDGDFFTFDYINIFPIQFPEFIEKAKSYVKRHGWSIYSGTATARKLRQVSRTIFGYL